MGSPRHLWSGDWRSESEEAARRRAREPEPPPAPEDPLTVEQARAEPFARQHSSPHAWRLRVAALAMFITTGALIATVVLVSSDSSSSGTQSPVPAPPQANLPATSPTPTPTGRRAWLGVQTQLAGGGGAYVVTVVPGGPAEQAGLQAGDIITSIEGQPVNYPADITNALASMRPGDQVELDVSRQGQAATVTVTLAARPSGTP